MNIQEWESHEHIMAIAPIVSLAYRLGKQQRHDEAYVTLLPYLEHDEVPNYFCQPAGWTIYRYIKEHIEQLSPSQAKTIFGYYLNFCGHEPNLLHSFIMLLALNYHKLHLHDFSILDFCRQWGLDRFMPDDYKSSTSTALDGRTITFPSLAVRVATQLYKELKERHNTNEAQEFLSFFETVKEKCPDYEFTPLYIANLYAWIGEKDKSIDMFKNMLAYKPKWYLWHSLGNLLDDSLKLSCYCKALTMVDKEDYAGELHLTLARMLLHSEPTYAAAELDKYTTTYSQNGWKMKAEAYEMAKTLAGVTVASDLIAFHEKNTIAAEDFVYHNLPLEEFVYVGNRLNKRNKMMAWLKAVNNDHHKPLSTNVPKSTMPQKAMIGDMFLCRYRTDDHRTSLMTMHPTGRRMSMATPTRSTASGTTRKGYGTVRQRQGQPYAFVDNNFIPPHLCQSAKLSDGQQVQFVASRQEDGRYRVVKIIATR